MKTITQLIALTALAIGIAYAQEAKEVALQVGAQRLRVPAELPTAKEGSRIYIVAGEANPPSDKNAMMYGMRPVGDGRKIQSQPLLELRTIADNRVVKTITVAEFFGKESGEWKRVPDESSGREGKQTSAHAFTAFGQHFRFFQTTQVVQDEHLPLGRAISIAFAMSCEQPVELSARFMGECDGSFSSEGSDCILGNAPDAQGSGELLVIKMDGGSVKSEGKPKKGEPTRFTMESPSVKLVPGKQTVVMSLLVAGTSVGEQGQAQKQSEHIAKYFTDQESIPDVIALTRVNRQNTNPGDTVLYTIVYHNIGTAPAKDITINNPIPSGTRFIENTAEGEGGTVGFTRSDQNVVSSIEWKFETQIMPGESRSARFSVVVQ